ncbi:hypothetical protein [Rhodococcus sp. JT-3]|uniref:hypothetical protein n=1 Tax=Rhodococcus sp. JT-3 TaxID=1973213 RepID=UPI001E5F11BE|nr:hypothetical protein [Rhodococcus sp. JT-3]
MCPCSVSVGLDGPTATLRCSNRESCCTPTRIDRPEIRDSGELLIEIPLSDASIVEITVLDASAGWIDSRVRGLCSSLDKIDRRAQRVLRGGFSIGWIELESERHGVIDYWEDGVNNEYPISIVWNGNSWEEAATT